MSSWMVKQPGGGGVLWQLSPPLRCCCFRFCSTGDGAVCIRVWWLAVLLLAGAALLSILKTEAGGKTQILESHGRGLQELVEITSFEENGEVEKNL
jgi:hypothetical protein